MAKIWKYEYNDNEIIVENDKNTTLTINGEKQQSVGGVNSSCDLEGTLPTGEKVRAKVNGKFFEVECELSVNNILLMPVEEE